MSSIRSWLLLILTLTGTSCKKLIGVPPPTDQLSTAQVFANDVNAIAAQNGVYTGIMTDSRHLLDGGASLYFSLSSDDLARTQSSPTEDAFTLNALTADNILISNLYTSLYKTIGLTNINLEQLPGATGVTDSIRRQLMGESKLVRALCYFYLINAWGEVPLVLSSDYSTTNHLPRTPLAAVYAQIIQDLTDAQGLLGVPYRTYTGQAADRTLPNQATATALLARVDLYQGNWAGAIQQASTLIDDNRYQMEKDLGQVFLSSSREVIWQLQPVTSRYTEEGALFLPAAGLRPNYKLTNSLLSAFETGDQRKSQWTHSQSILGQVYTYPYKYKMNSADTTGPREYTTIVRLAELYLIRAEARTRLGQGMEALSDLNIIRSRAGLPLLNNMDSVYLLNAIKHERQIEFFAEYGHRWMDLKRTGQADLVLGPEKTGWQPADALYPFPTGELQRNPSLVQNQDY